MYNETQLLTVHYTTLLSALHIRSLQFVQVYNLQISPPWFMWSTIQQMQNTFPAVTFQLHCLSNTYTMQSTWIYFIGVFFHRLQACQDNATIYALYLYKDKRYLLKVQHNCQWLHTDCCPSIWYRRVSWPNKQMLSLDFFLWKNTYAICQFKWIMKGLKMKTQWDVFKTVKYIKW